MSLEMKKLCENCGISLAADAEAFICTYECTFCPTYAEGMKRSCPNCGGELVHRPRPKEEQ